MAGALLRPDFPAIVALVLQLSLDVADSPFRLMALMHMLTAAPDLDVAFEDLQDRDSARDFMDLVDPADENGDSRS